MIEAQALTLNYGERNIIEDLQLEIPTGKITVLVGANGCGKSTLLRALARLMKPATGVISLDGREMKSMTTKEIARKLAVLPQGPISPEGLTVHQLVKQGRYPHQSWRKQWSKEDEWLVDEALQVTGMMPLRAKTLDSLSGGQRQRAWIAMTLAQKTDTILLDEPTTYLDLTHQIDILDLLYDLNEAEERTIVMVLHDLNLASRYADHMIAVKDKGIYVQGKPEEVVTKVMVKEVFQLDADIISDPLFGTPLCIPHGKGRKVVRANKAKELIKL
ncbi:ABC transporter ATP-binding protein [Alkalihalobacillus pseudalcaliphilus]|uniref:ABC transporter ATP-binding protein n=1 Tax=Alkalihalobacillus pseudalcaliphilus TaxID=79884 RepID=UPI00064DA781|nr:ABC transporter ATP-binding protein [Alkalihalobacillus pseudalcaliphilus]KMK75231.1 ABC transporter [Alkalihalobacillus pseudalcaliphilus]